MSRNRTIYNIYGVFSGPAPGSGYHFIDRSGKLNNTVSTLGGENYNLIKNLQRVQNASYSIGLNTQKFYSIGKKSAINNATTQNPTVTLNFDYLQYGVLNELRMGFYSNYKKTNQYDNSGDPYYSDNYNVCLLSGFLTRGLERENNDLQWPMKYRDQRNIFIVAKEGNEDLNKQLSSNNYQEIDTNAENYGVYGFGNCYINSYSAAGAVNSFPVASVQYTCDNLAYFSKASGSHIPHVNVNRQMQTGVKFAVPSLINESSISALRPGDISLDFVSYSEDTNILAVNGTGIRGSNSSEITGLNVDFNSLKINSYQLSFDIPREEDQSFGEKIPRDRYVKFPIPVGFSFTTLYSEGQTGSINQLLNQNNNYDITVKINNPESEETAVQYDLKKAKLNSYSSNINIGSNVLYSFDFETEIDPDDYSKGLFMSGLVNTDPTTKINVGFLLMSHVGGPSQGDGDYLLQNDGVSKFVTSSFDLLY